MKDGNGKNSLHFAAQLGQTDLCRHLMVDHRFDVNAQDDAGQHCFGQSSSRLELVAVIWAVSRRVRLSSHQQQMLTVCLQGRRHWHMQRVLATETLRSSCWPLALKSAGPGPAERTPFTPLPLQVQADVEFEAFDRRHALPSCHPTFAGRRASNAALKDRDRCWLGAGRDLRHVMNTIHMLIHSLCKCCTISSEDTCWKQGSIV